MGKRAKGRSLQDFFPLNAAEQRILEAAAAGDLAEIGTTRPEAESDSNTVRATFLRFLALGGDDEAPVHERGLWVQGAWITGGLDLSHAEIAGPTVFERCRFDETAILRDARIAGPFSLEGSHLPGLNADRLTCRSGLFLRNGFSAAGEVRLLGAKISSNLDCSCGKFENPNGHAINADGMDVGLNLVMSHRFIARGEVRLLGATIGGNWECDGGIFVNPKGRAISADRMNVRGYIFMKNGFKARGEIHLSGVTIGGNLECDGGIFENQGKVAIHADGMKVDGNVFVRHGFSALGEVRLINASIGCDFDCSLGSFYSQNSFAINF
ncbi:MAG: hypothetical protein ACP5M5_04685 [Acidibrevibacterium sp.]|uniref:hypothetical protein n=1 Tax=Acidibrevibacterium sp. TaxID=2606776 RepID=UPI003D08DA7D